MDADELIGFVRRYAATVLALVFLVVGLALLEFIHRPSDVVKEVAAVLISTSIVTVGWNFLLEGWQTRKLRTIVQKELDAEVKWRQFGMRQIGIGNVADATVKRELAHASIARLACLYDPRWGEDWAESLRAFLNRPDTSLVALLPDPDDAELIRDLAARHSNMRPGEFQGRVGHLLAFLAELRAAHTGRVVIRALKQFGPSYTVYLFEGDGRPRAGVLRVYGHSMGRGTELPELVVNPGPMLDYLNEDFRSLERRAVIGRMT